MFPGIQGRMVGAAVFGRLLKDLKIDCKQPLQAHLQPVPRRHAVSG